VVSGSPAAISLHIWMVSLHRRCVVVLRLPLVVLPGPISSCFSCCKSRLKCRCIRVRLHLVNTALVHLWVADHVVCMMCVSMQLPPYSGDHVRAL
jgi:hypothetical protein